jgi:hypothetical protein
MTALERGRVITKAATILLASGVMSVSGAPLAVAQHDTLQVHLRNDAHVADDTLDEARHADSALSRVVELLRRINIHPSNVCVTNNRPLESSPFVEGFIYHGDETIYLPTYSDTYRKAKHGDKESLIKLASVIAHEMVHVEQDKKRRKHDEMAAYDHQLRTLRHLNASRLTIIRVEKAKSQQATRKVQNPQ